MNIDEKTVNSLRVLGCDVINNAKSGHSGIVLSSAPILYTLYSRHINVDNIDSNNILRDRFVMSAGHGSAILYSTFFAMGFKISVNDLKNFRKFGSNLPGHPEYNIVSGVDCTTGPLGQGLASAVGMAFAEKIMANRFNKDNLSLFDNYTYVLIGDGCLMEGVSYEAMSFAGNMNLNKLIILYDCNNVTLDNDTKNTLKVDVEGYVKSLGFNFIEVKDGNSVDEIDKAIALSKKSDKPNFIKIDTKIGFGSNLENTNKAHGAVFSDEEMKILRKNLDITSKPFTFDKDVECNLAIIKKRFSKCRNKFAERINDYRANYAEYYKLLQQYLNNDFGDIFEKLKDIPESINSTRALGNIVLNELAKYQKNIIVGTADVSSSTKVKINDDNFITSDDFTPRNIAFGIREFAMSCIANGINLYGGLKIIVSTFLVFSDYMKAGIRLTCLMHLPVTYVLTHDSISVGEDGPTHQPIEQLDMLRSIPNLKVFRPCNLTETKFAYYYAITKKEPSALIFTRQKVNEISSNIEDCKYGAYIIGDEGKGELNAIIVATGSEVGLAMQSQIQLFKNGYNVRVVSVPCFELFKEQKESYINQVIPKNFRSIICLEESTANVIGTLSGISGEVISINEFGKSGSETENKKYFGFTVDNVVKTTIKCIKKNRTKTYVYGE